MSSPLVWSHVTMSVVGVVHCWVPWLQAQVVIHIGLCHLRHLVYTSLTFQWLPYPDQLLFPSKISFFSSNEKIVFFSIFTGEIYKSLFRIYFPQQKKMESSYIFNYFTECISAWHRVAGSSAFEAIMNYRKKKMLWLFTIRKHEKKSVCYRSQDFPLQINYIKQLSLLLIKNNLIEVWIIIQNWLNEQNLK